MKPSQSKLPAYLPLVVFLSARIPILLALPYDGLKGYGDLQHFFNLAALPGLPNIHYWIEFPPGFAFLNELIYGLSGGVEHVFTYLFVLLILAADICSVLLFQQLEKHVYPGEASPSLRSLIFAALIAGLPYTWWYFDSITVFFIMLAANLLVMKKQPLAIGAAIGAGILVKLFPALILPVMLRTESPRRGAVIAGAALAVYLLPTLALYALSPAYTSASLVSQSARGSVETVWAILDGNYQTGNYGPELDRLDPAKAYQSTRNPAVVSPLALLAIFAAGGVYLFLKARLKTNRQALSFFGLTMVIFFIWSPAWSPQWVLYLIPLILLVLDVRLGLLTTAALVLVNLLEWPLLLSRGMFYTLPLTVSLRLILLILLGIQFYSGSRLPDQAQTEE